MGNKLTFYELTLLVKSFGHYFEPTVYNSVLEGFKPINEIKFQFTV